MPVTATARPAVWDVTEFQKELFSSLRHHSRFFITDRLQRYLSEIISFARNNCIQTINPPTPFFRARINPWQELVHAQRQEALQPEELGPPRPYEATGGRLNPQGIPYYYLSEARTTAVAEVRPWVGAYVTIGTIELLQAINVVNLTVDDGGPSGNLLADFHWTKAIARNFSIPQSPDDSVGYVPTQYLAEVFKREGFDGLIYNSALNEGGRNLTIFDAAKARCVSTELIAISKITYQFTQA